MGQFPNLKNHISTMIYKPGLVSSLVPQAAAPSGPGLIGDLDFSSSRVQLLPETAAALADALGDASALASHIVPCTELSGNLVDVIAAKEFAATNSPLQGQDGYGLNAGSGMTDRKVVEIVNANEAFACTDSSVMDSAGTSIAMIHVFRAWRPFLSNNFLSGKAHSSDWDRGYHIRVGAGSALKASYGDGVSTKTTAGIGTYDDGAWHVVALVYNATTDTLWFMGDSGTAVSVDASSAGSAACDGGWTIGDLPTLAGIKGVQTAYFAGFEGAAAELIDQTAIDSFWTHASHTLVDTAVRSSLVSVPVGAEALCHFAGDTAGAQLPVGYNPAFSDADKLGLYTHTARTNLIPYSDTVMTGWLLGGGGTRTEAEVDGPSGLRDADTLSKTAGTQWASVYDDTAVLEANTTYMVSAWISRISGSGCTLEVRNSGDTQEFAYRHLSEMATDTWEQVFLYFTTDAAAAFLVRFRPSPGATAETAKGAIKHIQVMKVGASEGEVEKGARVMAKTEGSSAVLAVSNYAASGNHVNIQKGEIASTFVVSWDSGAASQTVHDDDAASTDQRQLYVDHLTRMTWTVRGGATTEDAQATAIGSASEGTESTFRLLWDISDESLGYETVGYLNGFRKNGAALPYEQAHGSGFGGVQVGAAYNATNQLNGCIQSIKSYDGPLALADDPTPANVIGTDFWTTVETIDFNVSDLSGVDFTAQNYTAGGWTRDPTNVVDNDPNLDLTVDNATTNGAEIASTYATYQYGSYRFNVQTSGVYGCVAGLFYYFSDTEEIDMEILSRENDEAILHCVVHTNDGDTHKFVPLNFDPSAAFHDYRFDWYGASDPGSEARVEFFVDDVHRATIYRNVPTTAGSILINQWSTADASWADGLTAADATLLVSHITMYYDNGGAP